MKLETINLIQAKDYPIGTKFEVFGNVQYLEMVATNPDIDGDISKKKLIWEDGNNVFATDYELGLELIVME